MDELLRECLGFRMGAAFRRADRLFNRTLRPTGLSHAHVYVLACLFAGEQRARDLARKTGFEESTVSRLLLDLSRRKFIRRRPAPGDRRSSIFRTAPRAESLRTEMERLVRRAEERLRREMTQEDVVGAFRALEAMERLP